jgi:hypothetical protein
MPPTVWSNQEPLSYLNFRKVESGVLDSKMKFGLILHRFKGLNHLRGKENKATEEHTLALN